MEYNELKNYCKVAKISLSDLAMELGMTLDGLRTAFENKSLSVKHVLPICEKFAISPNKFFGVEDQHGDIVFGGQNKQGRKQIINNNTETISVLREQLATKDAQIDRLLTLLAQK